MYRKSDPYTFTEYAQIGTEKQPIIGSLQREYEATLYDDVKCDLVSTGAAAPRRKYLVQLTQRVRIANPNGISFAESASGSPIYNNYPVLLQSSIQLAASNATDILDLELLSYSPKTVTTKIDTSGANSDSAGVNTTNGQSTTIGSSTSQTNSYGASVSVSMEGGSASANYEHSSTDTSEHSNTLNSEQGTTKSHDASNTASMSIKDWGAYAYVNQLKLSAGNPAGNITWTFGQEYPWDVLQCRNFVGGANKNPDNPTQLQLALPQGVLNRLWDGLALYPPSHLATYGFEFISKSMWLLTIPNESSNLLNVESSFDYYTASHSAQVSSQGASIIPPTVYRDSIPATLVPVTGSSLTTSIDVCLLALNPISAGKKSAILGFVTNQFLTQPSIRTPFLIVSVANDLLVKDNTAAMDAPISGMSYFSATDYGLIATIGAVNDSLLLTVYFKVTDTDDDYNLFLKHWVGTGSAQVDLFITVNGGGQAFHKTLYDAQAEDGSGNLLTIKLRNLDFASVDYHDYIRMGLNRVDVRITSAGPVPAIYQLQAMSVERS